jgi:hypothetical protein
LAGISFLAVPRMNTHTAIGRVEYQLFVPLRAFEEVRYFHNTPLTPHFESQTSLAESLTGFMLQKRLRGFDVNTTYALRYSMMGTNLNNSAHTWSNDVDARVGWGNIRRVRLTGLYRYGRYNYVQQIGGYSLDNHYGARLETTALPGFRLSGEAEQGRLQLLNISGKVTMDYTNYRAQVETRKLMIMGMRGLNDGSGGFFPTDLIQPGFITVPLPIAGLIATPLLTRITRITGASITFRPRRNFDVGADWRRENDLLFSSLQNYRIWEVRGQYRLGKITVEGGVGNLFNRITTEPSVNGLRINRYYVRIRRDFNFF